MQQPTTFQQLQNRGVPKTLKSELKRTALIAQIQDLGEYRLTALIAPSGYGKTTVLGQYARLASRPIIWMNLGDDNVDQLVLGQSMLKALLQLIPTLGTELDLATNVSPGISPGSLASLLEQATENLSFIIEGIEVLGSEAGQWLRTFVNLLPEGHHVFVSGFENTGLPLARMIADGLARLIGPGELAFTLEESAVYFKTRNCISPLEETHHALEGWPAGLALVAAGASVGLGPTDLVLEVMQALPDDVRQHLPEAAVFDVWIEHSAKDLGLNLSSGWLQHVRRVGLPIAPLGSGAFRPHRVLLEALELQLRLNPDRHAQLHGLVAQKRELSGQVLEALRHYQLAGNTVKALGLASQLVRQYELRSEFHLIERILGSFHEGQLSPQLKALLGRVWIDAGQILRAETLLQDVLNTGQAKADALFGLGVAAFVRTQHHKANDYFDQALACADREALSVNIQRIRVGLLIELQRLPEALEQSHRLVQIAEKNNDSLLLSRGLASVVAVLGAQRAFEEAIHVGHKALRVYETLGMPVASMVLLHNFANALLARGQLEQAQTMIERGIKVGIDNGIEDLSSLYSYRGLIAMLQGDFTSACETYQLALNMCGISQDDFTAHAIRLNLWDAALHAGHADLAAHSRQRAREVIPSQDTDTYQMYQFCEGLQAFVNGDLLVADQHLRQCDQTGNDFWIDGRSRAFRAEIARREHRLEQNHVQYLLAGLEGSCDDLLCIDAKLLAGLYSDCVRRNWWPERFAPLVARIDNLHTKPVPSSHELELDVITLGEIKFLLAGTPVHIPLTKAGELLVWLAMNGPATREQIMDALWEGSNEQRHLEYFKISVRRMRATLSENPAVTDFNPLPFENGKYRLSERFRVKLDVTAAAQALKSRDVPTMQQALELQVGEFMPGSELEWVSDQRQRHLEQALELAMTLGSQLEEISIVEAQQVYQRAIALDRLHEPAHLALIRVCQRAGDLPGARRAYASYSRMLAEEFDSQPSTDLKRILQIPVQGSEHQVKPSELNG
jgi:LuxR family transcriptional regulator, maltose regulon positive regulatory protein